uniref:TPR repeat-containing protein MJ1345 n=1 Tax=Anthurium amnicola TaxID=1678845 RepID=A0A1D1YXX1_9ARAE
MGALLPGQRIPFSLLSLPPRPILPPGTLRLPHLQTPGWSSPRVAAVSASGGGSRPTSSDGDQMVRKLRSAAGALVLTATAAAAALCTGRFAAAPVRAEPSPAPPASEVGGEAAAAEEEVHAPSALSQFLESNDEAVEALRSLLYEKLDNGEYAEGLRILDRLIAARPSEAEWRFLAARVHRETGDAAGARRLLEEILAGDPLSFEALFEKAVLMDRCGEGEAAVEMLERALEDAREGKREKEAREVRLIMAQVQFLQKKVDEALRSYEELASEDPRDYRPYFCQGVIYSLLERNQEAREKFAKYKELSPRKFQVEGFLQTPLSRFKLFDTTPNAAAV